MFRVDEIKSVHMISSFFGVCELCGTVLVYMFFLVRNCFILVILWTIGDGGSEVRKCWL